MFKKLLVPLDGSELAEQALPFVVELTDKLGLETTLLHVCEVRESPSMNICRSYVDRVTGDMIRQLGEGKKSEAQAVAAVKGEAVPGIAADSILIYAEKNSPDMILISRHGRSGSQGFLLGSVAHRVLTAARMPVLVVHPESTRRFVHSGWPQSILVLLDGSDLSERILPFVADLSGNGKNEKQITLFTVCEPPDLISDYPEAVMPLSWEEHVKRAKIVAQQRCLDYLAGVQKQLGAKGLSVNTHVALGDRVTDEILKYTEAQRFDLIAMTTHGQSGMASWPFGHVSDRIIQTSRMPLLLVRPRSNANNQ